VIINIYKNVQLPVRKKYLLDVTFKIFRSLKFSSREVSFFFCDNKTIQNYNRIYLKKYSRTDVMAFADSSKFPGYDKKYLGDIVISVEQAREQAKAMGHSVKKELVVLVVHGILHLLGYDDTKPLLRKKMFKKQETIVNKII